MKRKKKNRKKEATCPKKKKSIPTWRQQGNVSAQRRRKKNKGNLKKPMCTWAFLSIKKKFIPTRFFLYFGKKTFWWAKEETLGLAIYFSSFLRNQIHSKKVFISIFFQKFSIHHVSPPNKHTLKQLQSFIIDLIYIYIKSKKKKKIQLDFNWILNLALCVV